MRIEANGTDALNKLTDVAVSFVETVLLPPMQQVSGLAEDLVDLVRGPFRRWRLQNLQRLAESVRARRRAQGIEQPRPLPPKATQAIMTDGSFVDSDVLRELWAQLIVNAQDGLSLDAYLFEVLGKLNSEDAGLLQETLDGVVHDARGTERLIALGLVQIDNDVVLEMGEVDVDLESRVQRIRVPKHGVIQPSPYLSLTPLGKLLLAATTKTTTELLAGSVDFLKRETFEDRRWDGEWAQGHYESMRKVQKADEERARQTREAARHAARREARTAKKE